MTEPTTHPDALDNLRTPLIAAEAQDALCALVRSYLPESA